MTARRSPRKPVIPAQAGISARTRRDPPQPDAGGRGHDEDGTLDGYIVDAAGERIHFVVQGRGTPVLLLHGAFGSGAGILATGFGTALAERYRVVAPDSLAHGGSDAPADRARYGARARASHLAAVLDGLGIARAHVVGYSMGGWMASALATFHPERIASLVIGGWDVVGGMYTPAAAWGLEEIDYSILGAMVRRDRPELLAWLRPGNEPALAAAIDGMNDLAGLAEGVARCPASVALWQGEEDLYFEAAAGFAAAHGFPLIALPGDHVSTLEQHGGEAARQVMDFIARAEREAAGPAAVPAAGAR